MRAANRTDRRPTVSSRRLAVALLFAVVLVAVACGSERADDGSGDSRPPGAGEPIADPHIADLHIADLHIIVRHPTLDADIEYHVGCLGDTFPVTPEVEGVDGETGCALLADEAIRSRLIDGLPEGLACTMIYGGPDEADIVGDIDDQPVDTTITRANGCEIASWDSMIGLIPPPIGVTD